MLTKKEAQSLRSIVIPSENDPRKPEFPPEKPCYPATPTYRIKVPGFSNVWLKDESINPTGTHKDRIAWEVVVTYRQILKNKKHSSWIKKLPGLSILSSGPAAVAIQFRLRQYRLPNLRVLLDNKTPPATVQTLKKLGCHVFLYPLKQELLTWSKILQLTNNPNGFDITSNTAFDPTVRFYDWMSYEILASRADYIFIPYGTGQLFENILNIARREGGSKLHDPRFQSTPGILAKCNFLGATTVDYNSLADKLFAYHLPFSFSNEQWTNYCCYSGFCGKDSGVYVFDEEHLKMAMAVAKHLGIDAEPSGLAGLALMLQLKSALPKNKKYLIVSTGRCKLLS